MYLGVHVIADLYGIDFNKIDKAEKIEKVLEEAVKYSGLNKVCSKYHQFEPFGATGVIVLEESHVSAHTWAEYGYVAIDVFTCESEEKAIKAINFIIEKLKPKKIKQKIIKRGRVRERDKFIPPNYNPLIDKMLKSKS